MKERIIGAAVLVLVVVLVVPVFLDGPPGGDEIVSARVPLPGQAEQKSQTVVLDRDRKDPVPANGGNEPVQSPQQPQRTVRQQDTSPAPVTKKPTPKPVVPDPVPEEAATATAAASTTGMWAVQLGSFGSQENAERLAADLRKQGFAAFLSQLSTSSGQLHRVRIGPQKDRESAEAIANRLLKAGHQGQVVPHP
ncbi:MAG: SPOR domain-containing protein [Gammaproteobacteria bacterium]|nr:SPOR domain-containing protein [Gammaproteobacteria bacterium]